MHVPGQTVDERAEKGGRALIGQQVEIVDKNVAGDVSRQLMAEIVGKETAAGRVGGTGVAAQQLQPGAGERVLHAFPEDREVIGIHADADDPWRLRPCALAEIPIYRRRFAVAHRRDDGGQGAA